jgi:hypothetical protein
MRSKGKLKTNKDWVKINLKNVSEMEGNINYFVRILNIK